MRPVNTRRVKIKCSVRGCPNTKEVFAFSRSAEAGNTPVICLSCAKEIGKLAEDLLKEKVEEVKKPEVAEVKAEAPGKKQRGNKG